MRGPIPRGLLWSIGLYAIGAAIYVGATTGRSTDYQAAQYYQEANEVLGPDGGQHASSQALTKAFEDLVEAARLEPRVRLLHEELELLDERFAQRRLQVPDDLRKRADALARRYQQAEDRARPAVGHRGPAWGGDPLFPRSARKYGDPIEAARHESQVAALREGLAAESQQPAGRRVAEPRAPREPAPDWDPNQLLREPARKLEWSLLGWLAIALAWAGLKLIEHQRLAHEQAQGVDAVEGRIDASVRAGEAGPRRDPGLRDRG